MATTGTYFIDTSTFEMATKIWMDSARTILAPDGYYSINGIYRRQLNGLLQPVIDCPPPTPTPTATPTPTPTPTATATPTPTPTPTVDCSFDVDINVLTPTPTPTPTATPTPTIDCSFDVDVNVLTPTPTPSPTATPPPTLSPTPTPTPTIDCSFDVDVNVLTPTPTPTPTATPSPTVDCNFDVNINVLTPTPTPQPTATPSPTATPPPTPTPVPPISATVTYNDVSCYNGSDGSITVSNISGGVGAPYYVKLNIDGTYQLTTTSRIYSNLPNGSYTIYVKDVEDNETTYYITVSQPTELTANITVNTYSTCGGGTDGVITISSSGGTWPKTYTLYADTDSPYTTCGGTLIGEWTSINSGSPSVVVSNLSEYGYCLTVTDANGCMTNSGVVETTSCNQNPPSSGYFCRDNVSSPCIEQVTPCSNSQIPCGEFTEQV